MLRSKARLDGYVISISGGGPFVGEKKLIRIEEVKRTAAYASLISENGAEKKPPARKPADKPADDSAEAPETEAQGEQVQSNGSASKRRRGRRGGPDIRHDAPPCRRTSR